MAQKRPQPGEDASEVVFGGGENGVGGIAWSAIDVAAAEVTFSIHLADDGLDGGSASVFALDDADHAALLTRNENVARIGRIVAAISLMT